MWSIMAASVVVLPEPVVPVTSTRPRGSRASFLTTAGSSSSSKLGMRVATCRMAMEMLPRWRYTFTRNRPTSGPLYAKSISLVSLKWRICLSLMSAAA